MKTAQTVAQTATARAVAVHIAAIKAAAHADQPTSGIAAQAAAEAAEAAQQAAYDAGAEATGTAEKLAWEAVANLAAEARDVWTETGVAEWDRAVRFRGRASVSVEPTVHDAAGSLLMAVAEGLAVEQYEGGLPLAEARQEWLGRAARLDEYNTEVYGQQEAGGLAPVPETEPANQAALNSLRVLLAGAEPREYTETNGRKQLRIAAADGFLYHVEWT